MYYIRFVEMAGRVEHGDPPKPGAFLEAYDPDYKNGRGMVYWTNDVSKAMTFPRIMDALECYQQVSILKPMRIDGRPNRPLTSCTVTVTQETGDLV